MVNLDKIPLIRKFNEAVGGKRVSGVAAFFADEHALLDAAKKTYSAGYRKFDAISPFPIHGMDQATGIQRSNIPWVTFVMGLVGLSFAAWFTWWTSAVDYRVIIGGKPFHFGQAFSGYVPIMFEFTVLFAALSSVGAMLCLNGLPQIDPPIIDPDLTCDKFALFIPETEQGFEPGKAESHLRSIGAVEVRKVAEF